MDGERERKREKENEIKTRELGTKNKARLTFSPFSCSRHERGLAVVMSMHKFLDALPRPAVKARQGYFHVVYPTYNYSHSLPASNSIRNLHLHLIILLSS